MSQRVLRIGLVVLLVAGLGLVWWSRNTLTPAAVVAWVEGLGVWGPSSLWASMVCPRLCLFRERYSRWLAGHSLARS